MNRLKDAGSGIAAVVAALLVAMGLMLFVGAPPFEALWLLVVGSVGSFSNLSNTLMAWVPLVLATTGLLVTFAAGLWNIGVEGQIIAGAILATWVARDVHGPVWLLVVLTMLAGAIGGALWALLAGVLKVYGKVNEIFGGLGLYFVALAINTYLIIGPWKRAGIASTSGTSPIPEDAWLPTVGSANLSPAAVGVALGGIILVYFLLRGTRFGLRLKAVGTNMRSAYLFGIPTTRYMLSAFAIGGGLAGLAGTIQVTGFLHRLVPAISGGYGFLGILVALLVATRALWIAPVALFFAMISSGGTQLQLRLNLDSSLGGVLQGVLVLFTLLAQGWQSKIRKRRKSRIHDVTESQAETV